MVSKQSGCDYRGQKKRRVWEARLGGRRGKVRLVKDKKNTENCRIFSDLRLFWGFV